MNFKELCTRILGGIKTYGCMLGSSAKTEVDSNFVPLENQTLSVYNTTSHLLYSNLYLV